MTHDDDPWTYRISAGPGPVPDAAPLAPGIVTCPACQWPMVSVGRDPFGPASSTRRHWFCNRCWLKIFRQDGDVDDEEVIWIC